MHGRGNALQLMIFVLLMGPLIWLSQTMRWGDTGTFLCVVIGLVGGFLIIKGGKSVTRSVRRPFQGSQKGAAADFLFGPTEPTSRHMEMLTYRKLAGDRVGAWNAPMLPSPQQTPRGPYIPIAARVQQMPVPNPMTPLPLSTRTRQASGPILLLGPEIQMSLTASLGSAVIVDGQPRRMCAPVFVEEWIRLGLGLLVVDVSGGYANALAPLLPESFGFLAGSYAWQDHLTVPQQSHYMPLEDAGDAENVGQCIVAEGLQVIVNVSSYQDTTLVGEVILALLSGIERFAQNPRSKPCAILITDARPLFPVNDDDRVIEDLDLAQEVFDQLIQMLEQAGQTDLKRRLALYLATSTIEGIAEEALMAACLWVVNSTNEQEIKRVQEYVDLSREEAKPLTDGEVLLFDVPGGNASFVHFRRTKLRIKQRPMLSSQAPNTDVSGNMETQESDQPLGEQSGLEEKA